MTGPLIRNSIRRLRFEHGEMTQEELGRRAGGTRQTIIALEQGKYLPSREPAFRISRAFGARLEDVFDYGWHRVAPAVAESCPALHTSAIPHMDEGG